MPVKPCNINFSGFKMAPFRIAGLTMELAGMQLADGRIGKQQIGILEQCRGATDS